MDISRRTIIIPAFVGMLCATSTFAQLPSDQPFAGEIWIDKAVVASLPMSGPAWENVKAHADQPLGTPNLSDQDDDTDVLVLAKALVYVRTNEDWYRQEVIRACIDAMGTEVGGRTLSLARGLVAYVIAADLVTLPAPEDELFRAWLGTILDEDLSGRTLRSTHEDRPNNWGTHAGASRMAVAFYLDDREEMEEAARVFRGYLGESDVYAEFKFGDDLSWQADSLHPVGINPRFAILSGQAVDGVLTDDQRRSGLFTWPPPKENYVYEGLQGALAQAIILDQAGYDDVWTWGDYALLRAFRWLHDIADYPAVGDDTWQPHVMNSVYGTDFPAVIPARHGKNVGWTDWTHTSPVIAGEVSTSDSE